MAIQIPSTIGLPPSTYVSDNLIQASMPVAEFTPSKPKFQKGVTIFRVTPDKSRFLGDLQSYGFQCELPLKIAFTAENFPSDQFTNEYGQSFLSKIADVASGGLRDISQMAGGKSADEILSDLNESISESGPMGKALGGMAGKAGKLAESVGKKGLKTMPGVNEEQASGMMHRMLKGARIDFPQTWKNSGYQPSYNLTVRLYNPNPGSTMATKQYITGPLAAILLLGLPRSKGLGTFTWPFFHKIHCKGLFSLDPGVISNISVVKGGDQQQIAYNQRPAIIDVRIEIVSLYNSMIANERQGRGIKGMENRPTLNRYLANMEKAKNVSNTWDATPGQSNPPELETTSSNLASNPPTVNRPEDETGSRVSNEDKSLTDSLT